jgi:hypothetical protein
MVHLMTGEEEEDYELPCVDHVHITEVAGVKTRGALIEF